MSRNHTANAISTARKKPTGRSATRPMRAESSMGGVLEMAWFGWIHGPPANQSVRLIKMVFIMIVAMTSCTPR
ncbi:MAG: hypothetical protein R2755_15240 [Acidimicrobiales bacterium]